MDYTNILTALINRDIPAEDAEILAKRLAQAYSSNTLSDYGANVVINAAIEDYKRYGLAGLLERTQNSNNP